MSIGGTNNAVTGINLTDAELAQIYTTASGTVTFGDSSQTGNITFTTATPATTPGASTVVVQSTTGPGQIILNDTGTGTGLNGNGGSGHPDPGHRRHPHAAERLRHAAGYPGLQRDRTDVEPFAQFRARTRHATDAHQQHRHAGGQQSDHQHLYQPAAGRHDLGNLRRHDLLFQANYAGGDGNDLVLTAIAMPPHNDSQHLAGFG